MNDVHSGVNKLLEGYSALVPQIEQGTKKNKQGQGIRLPQRELVERLSIAVSEPVQEHNDVIRVIEAFQPNEGWVCSQSAVKWFSKSVFSKQLLCGYLLNAEMSKERASLHIVQVANGWQLTHVAEDGSQPPTGGLWSNESGWNAAALAENQTFISTDSKPEAKLWVAYRVFYGAGANGLRTIASRFHKFDGEAV